MNIFEEYTLETHAHNLVLLERLYSIASEELNENEKFDLINAMADFIQMNPQYSFIESFNRITDLIFDIINFCNSKEYSLTNFYKMYSNIISQIMKINEEISDLYRINVYFKGKDKYRVINTVLNNNVNFSIYFDGNSNSFEKNNQEFNILIISEETVNCAEDTHNFDKIIDYDKFMNDMFSLSEKIYNENYDYNYLFNSIIKAKNGNNDTIVVGSSYSLFGIDETKFNERIVNLSLQSQDIYYSFMIAKDIINKNKNIKKCYIGTGYWSFYHDLSKSVGSEIQRIENVYYPIFKDSNHYKYESKKHIQNLNNFTDEISKIIFNIRSLYNCFSKLIYDNNKNYFNSNRIRQSYSMLQGNKLNLISEESKFILGKKRAESHNKSIKYTETRIECECIFKKFIIYLLERNVQPIIVNFPATKYYNQFISKALIVDYYSIINSLKIENKFTFIDLCNNNLFRDEDFVDMDHASDIGAYKISNILNKNSYN